MSEETNSQAAQVRLAERLRRIPPYARLCVAVEVDPTAYHLIPVGLLCQRALDVVEAVENATKPEPLGADNTTGYEEWYDRTRELLK